jgi:hypothetical protein
VAVGAFFASEYMSSVGWSAGWSALVSVEIGGIVGLGIVATYQMLKKTNQLPKSFYNIGYGSRIGVSVAYVSVIAACIASLGLLSECESYRDNQEFEDAMLLMESKPEDAKKLYMKRIERSKGSCIAITMGLVALQLENRYFYDEADELFDMQVKLLEESKGLTHSETEEAVKSRDNIRSNRIVLKYIGEWKDGKKNGQGSLIYRNGNSYDGEWKDNLMNGHGKFIGTNGNSYDGEWKDNLMNGHGKIIGTNGDSFEGEWKDGELTSASGSSYSGGCKDGKRNGEGTLTFADGGSYSGGWKDGKMNGEGTLIFASGDSYIGGWKDGKQHGQGTLTFANGSSFTREWVNGELQEAVNQR